MSDAADHIPSIDHVGFLEDLTETPPYLVSGHVTGEPLSKLYSCAYCGVGDSGQVQSRQRPQSAPLEQIDEGEAKLAVQGLGRRLVLDAKVKPGSVIEVAVSVPLVTQGGMLVGELEVGSTRRLVILRESKRSAAIVDGKPAVLHQFDSPSPAMKITDMMIGEVKPTSGCVKLRTSMGHQPTTFPIHVSPSVRTASGEREPISYAAAVMRLADLLLAHRGSAGRTLIYACGQIDYFTVFAIQEVFRLLGIRNLTGNAEHCLNAGAVHNELLTGQEGPFLTVEQALDGSDRMYLLNGWNGMISHPPVFYRLVKRQQLDAWLVEVAVSETAQGLAAKIGAERILLVKPGSDPHLALAVAHEVLTKHEGAVDRRFIDGFADPATFEAYAALARRAEFAPEAVAARIAPEEKYVARLVTGIRAIAAGLARPGCVPINLPSVGLSQTKGAVSHCLWGNVLAMVGKYGLKPDGTPAGGTVRIPGQINAQSEVQGLSRNVFMGRLKMTEELATDAARRMGLPDDAYAAVLAEKPVPALDYSDPPEPGKPDLILSFGTQFESNMMGRRRWVDRLTAPGTTLVVMDPIPDPFTVKHADLIVPAPPHGAAAKLYQNGEWRLSLSVPRKRRPAETHTDATIIYDAMAAIARKLKGDEGLRRAHPDLAKHLASGYLTKRFEAPEAGGGLPRVEGEVSRPVLWQRVLDYFDGGPGRIGPLYCRPEHPDGRAITWDELSSGNSVVYGGVGTNRFMLDHASGKSPFADIHRRPRKFTFFLPKDADLALPGGILMNSGRGAMSDDKKRIQFAIGTFNSGKATPAVDMPDENPICVSETLAARLGLATGDRVRVTGVASGGSLNLPVLVTHRVKGDSVYVSFHKTRAEIERGQYLNDVTSHVGRCPYTSQSNFKVTEVRLEKLEPGTGTERAG
jgi:anaerobic selenocysteine-containing dehydrogenase